MAKNMGSRSWWWIVLAAVVVILGGLGYYWYTRTGPETEKTLIAREISPDRKGDVSGGVQGAGAGTGSSDAPAPGPGAQEQAAPEASVKGGPVSERFPIETKKTSESSEVASQGPIEELFVKAESAAPARETVPDKGGYCNLIDQQVSDFFHSLDTKAYFRLFKLEKDAYPYFAQTIKKLAAQPPQPAGEGIHPTTLLANIYFFSRALERKDLRVIKAVIENERDTMEFNLETFYRWLMLGKDCPNSGNVRPLFDITCRYAGFFLNTTGGRAYLFRRPLRLRILISYYCVLIVYQADRLGKNSYGLNVVPFIQPLKDELTHHPELEFQDQYISTLNRIENYYLQRR
jgi:hypothetical protein